MSEIELPPLEPLEADVRAVVSRASKLQTAPPGAKERVLARLEVVVQPPGGGGSPSGGTISGAPAIPLLPNIFRRALPLVASFGLGAMVAILVTRATTHAPAPLPPPVVRLDTPAAVSAAVAGAPEMAVAGATTITPAPLALHGPPPRGSGAAGNQLAAERALLDVARGALEGEDGAAALAATAQHERKFPNGVLVQEREAMAVRALMFLGRAAEARARAERFRTRFPESLLFPMIQSAIGAGSVP